MTDDPEQYEQGGVEVLLWVIWGGLGVASVGEIGLFVMMGGNGGSGGSLPPAQLAVVGVFTSIMLSLVALVNAREIGGGGAPTAMISWMLLKAIAITGLVVYQLADRHLYYWPFFGVFIIGLAILNPRRFR